MAPINKDAAGGDDKAQMMREAIKCVNGTIDFDRLAIKMGVSNGEAMRKRFKRFFEKDEEPLKITGSVLGSGADGGTAVPKTPKTPRTPRAKIKVETGVTSDAEVPSNPKAMLTNKKRKAAEAAVRAEEARSDINADHATDTPDVTDQDETPHVPVTPASPSPSKRARTTVSTSKTQTVKSPKPAKESKTPKARTVKTSKVAKEGKDTEMTGTGDQSHKTKEHEHLGSPEVQAVADGKVKAAEKANGGQIGEPEKTAILHGIAKREAAGHQNQK